METFLKFLSSQCLGGPFFLQCNYDKASLAKNIPKFYTECKEWEIYQQKQVSASFHVLDQIIWNNKFLKLVVNPYIIDAR